MSHSKQNRREFLEKVTLGVAGAGAAVSGSALTARPQRPPAVKCLIARWAAAAKRFRCWAWAAITSACRATSRKAFALSAPPSTTA